MSRWDNYSDPGGSKLGEAHAPIGLQSPLYNILWQPEDSNSRVVGTGDELLVDDTTDSLSSVLRKEIEGKVITSNPKSHLAGFKSNESLGDSFEDAKEELVSNSSMGSLHKGPTHTGKNKDTMQSMEVDLKLASRKRKPVDMDDTSAPPKHGR